MGLLDKTLAKWKRDYIAENKENWKTEFLQENADDLRDEVQENFEKERFNEIYELRKDVIWVLQQTRPTLPGAVFTLLLIIDELLQRENNGILGKTSKIAHAGEKPKIPMGNVKNLIAQREKEEAAAKPIVPKKDKTS